MRMDGSLNPVIFGFVDNFWCTIMLHDNRSQIVLSLLAYLFMFLSSFVVIMNSKSEAHNNQLI